MRHAGPVRRDGGSDVENDDRMPLPPLPSTSAAEAAAADPVAPSATGEPAPDTTTVQAITRRNWGRALGVIAASLVLLTTLGFAAATINEWANRPPGVVALDHIRSAPDSASATVAVHGGGTATAHWSASRDAVVLVANRLPELSADQLYAVWFVRDGDAVAAGALRPTPDGAAIAVLADEWEQGDVVLLTIEFGDEPGARPTGDPLAEIPTD